MMTPVSDTRDSPVAPHAELGPVQNGQATLELSGPWQIDQDLPVVETFEAEIDSRPDLKSIAFASDSVSTWDSSLVTFLIGVVDRCKARAIEVDQQRLPEGVQALLRLAYAVPEREGARRTEKRTPYLEKVGNEFIDFVRSTGEIMAFIGEAVLAFRRMLAGKARFRRSELWLIIQESGADALPIVSLVSFLVGLILAYIGVQQLGRFGAKIFVADLVGLAMVMQVGALITAIVLAGRTGAAFAAQLGTMQVNEEIDALRTLAIPPMDFLVLPRMMALMLMTPLLCLYADLMGILGGAFVASTAGGLTLVEYFHETKVAIGLNHVAQGVINSVVYGAIIAVSGCLRGMQCGRSASSVGSATTSAVVTAIVFIVIAAAILTIVFDAVGF